MTKCLKSCRDGLKLSALAIAIAMGFAIQAHAAPMPDTAAGWLPGPVTDAPGEAPGPAGRV